MNCKCSEWLCSDPAFKGVVADTFGQHMADQPGLLGVELRQYCGGVLHENYRKESGIRHNELSDFVQPLLHCEDGLIQHIPLQDSISGLFGHGSLAYVAVPLFNLPMLVGVVALAGTPALQQRHWARKIVVDISECYVAGLLHNPGMRPPVKANTDEVVQEKWEPLSHLVTGEILRGMRK